MLIGGKAFFTGNWVNAVDVKGRVSIPAEYRRDIGEDVCVITRSTSNCLRVYPAGSYEEVVKKLMAVSDNFNGAIMLNPSFKRIVGAFVSEAVEGKIDDHGRMLIPQPLRESIGLGKTAKIRGMGNVFEIWDEEEWLRKGETTAEDLQVAAADIAVFFDNKEGGAINV